MNCSLDNMTNFRVCVVDLINDFYKQPFVYLTILFIILLILEKLGYGISKLWRKDGIN